VLQLPDNLYFYIDRQLGPRTVSSQDRQSYPLRERESGAIVERQPQALGRGTERAGASGEAFIERYDVNPVT